MAWRLAFDGINDHCTFPTALSVNLGTEAYSFECSIVLTALPASGNFYGIVGRIGTITGFAVTSDGRLAMYSAGSLRYQTSAGLFLADSVQHVYRLEHDAGGAWLVYRDNLTTPIESGTYTFSTVAASMNRIGAATGGSGFLNGQIAYVDLQIPVGSQRWDADLSGGAGTTLPTVSGANQGTLVNFTVPDCWVFYRSGGAINAAASFSMPQMTVSASSAVDAPTFTASALFSMPQMQVSASGNVSSPVVGASVDFTMPQMVVAIDSVSTVPAYTAQLSFTMPQMSVSAAADVMVSGVSSSVAFSMPRFIVTASGSSAAPTLSASINFSMPQMVVQVGTFEADYYAVEKIDIPAASTSIELIAASRHIEYTNQSSHLEWRA